MDWKFTHPTPELKEIKAKLNYHFNTLDSAIYRERLSDKDTYYLQDILLNEDCFEIDIKTLYPNIDFDSVLQAVIVFESYEKDSDDCCQVCGSDELDSEFVGEVFCLKCLTNWKE